MANNPSHNGKRALITGISGQDGAYLAALLLTKGYEVVGTCRRVANFNSWRLHELGIAGRVRLVEMELLEFSNILGVIRDVKPDEVYNLAAQSFVVTSFEQPIYTAEVDGLGPMRILEAVRTVNPAIRFYQASTSEIFGKVRVSPQNEDTPFYPRSPYGVAKLSAHWMTVNYRECYGLFACSGILFNHESHLRGREFVSRKITSELALIRQGRLDPLHIGNMDATRDWGFAGDYVHGMWQMLQHERAEDFVLATGEPRSVRQFIETAAPHYGFDLEWSGTGLDETGTCRKTGKLIVKVDPAFYRPLASDVLVGNATKAATQLGWQRTLSFAQLVEKMAAADIRRAETGRLGPEHP